MKCLLTFIFFFDLVSKQSAALNYATQHAVFPELGGKWGTECHNTIMIDDDLFNKIERPAQRHSV